MSPSGSNTLPNVTSTTVIDHPNHPTHHNQDRNVSVLLITLITLITWSCPLCMFVYVPIFCYNMYMSYCIIDTRYEHRDQSRRVTRHLPRYYILCILSPICPHYIIRWELMCYIFTGRSKGYHESIWIDYASKYHLDDSNRSP